MSFREAAESYCRVVEGAQGHSREVFVREAAVTLSAVVAAAYLLPDHGLVLDRGAEVEVDGASISDERWRGHYDDVRNVLQQWDDYWTTFGAYDLDAETARPVLVLDDRAVNLSLADALVDVWRDLREGLNDLDGGMSSAEVDSRWRVLFRGHWGSHAIDALRAIHEQLREFDR